MNRTGILLAAALCLCSAADALAFVPAVGAAPAGLSGGVPGVLLVQEQPPEKKEAGTKKKKTFKKGTSGGKEGMGPDTGTTTGAGTAGKGSTTKTTKSPTKKGKTQPPKGKQITPI